MKKVVVFLAMTLGLFSQTVINGDRQFLGNIDLNGATSAITVGITNEGVTGTTVNKLAKLTGSFTVVNAATTDTTGIIGIVVSGAGTSGTAQIARVGMAACVFDGATTANDYVQISSTVAGDCHDAGNTYPTSGQVIGFVTSTNGAGGTYNVLLRPDIQASTGGGGGGAPISSPYVTTAHDPTLSNEVSLGDLASGYVKCTTASGTCTLSTVSSIPYTDLPSPSTSTGGIVQAKDCTLLGANYRVSKINADMTVTCADTAAGGGANNGGGSPTMRLKLLTGSGISGSTTNHYFQAYSFAGSTVAVQNSSWTGYRLTIPITGTIRRVGFVLYQNNTISAVGNDASVAFCINATSNNANCATGGGTSVMISSGMTQPTSSGVPQHFVVSTLNQAVTAGDKINLDFVPGTYTGTANFDIEMDVMIDVPLSDPDLNGTALSTTVTAGAGGVTANHIVQKSTANPLSYVMASSSSAQVKGIARSTVSAAATFQMAIEGFIGCVVEGTVTSGHYWTYGTTDPSACKDTGQSSLAAISNSVRVGGVFQASGTDGQTVTVSVIQNASGALIDTLSNFRLSGTAVLGTSAVSANSCATAVTVSATGVATTDVIRFTPNADISAVTGYGSAATDGLAIYPYPTSNNVNFKVCNKTGSSITPGAVTLNWSVER